jgi:hypothetical protein
MAHHTHFAHYLRGVDSLAFNPCCFTPHVLSSLTINALRFQCPFVDFNSVTMPRQMPVGQICP